MRSIKSRRKRYAACDDVAENEREMTFDAKHKKSSQAICSLRRRGGEEGIRLHFSQRTPYLKKKPCRAKNKCVHRCTHRFTHMPPACADMIRILLLCSAKRKTPSTGRGFRLDLFHCFDRISRRGGAPPVQGGGSAGSKGGSLAKRGFKVNDRAVPTNANLQIS